MHRAVEAHNGVVVVDALTPGSRFTILLPRAQARVALDNSQLNNIASKDDVVRIESRITGVAA